jgi:hypothetical protein
VGGGARRTVETLGRLGRGRKTGWMGQQGLVGHLATGPVREEREKGRSGLGQRERNGPDSGKKKKRKINLELIFELTKALENYAR